MKIIPRFQNDDHISLLRMWEVWVIIARMTENLKTDKSVESLNKFECKSNDFNPYTSNFVLLIQVD